MPAVVRPYNGVWPEIAPSAFIAETAAVIGDVVVGAEAGLWYGVVVRGDVNNVRIGRGTNIQDGTVVHVSSTGQGAYIGAEITIGHMAVIHACTLEDRCFVGMKACVMDDVVVETGAMVAAGALVTPGKRVLSGQLWAGVPARPFRDVLPEELADMTRSVERYKTLAQAYRTA